MRRISIFLATLLIAASALAASVADRSPFAQGHWWDPSRSGTGFDIFNAGGQVAFVWYTYDAAGRPIWYNAQGDVAGLGTQRMALWRQRWAGGRWSGYTAVGSVRLDVKHPESIELSWELDGKQGTWAIQPFTNSGVINEVDHSGHWFDPGQSGWGFTLTEQGDVFGGVVYTYDAAGEPTWLAGFDRGTAPKIELYACTGTCPSCAYAPIVTRSVGAITLDFRGEAQSIVHGNLALPMAAGINVEGAQAMQLSRAASSRPADRQLARFDSDAGLATYLMAGVANLAPQSPGGFSAGSPAAQYSTTNLVEAGVDEADVVKNDGARLYLSTLVDTGLYYSTGLLQAAIRMVRVVDGGAGLEVLGTQPLAGALTQSGTNAGLYLNGGRLVSVASGVVNSAVGFAPTPWTQGHTHVEVFDAGDPLLTSRWNAQIDGALVASRRIGDRLYVISRFAPWLEYSSAMGRYVAPATVAPLLPQVTVNGGDPAPLVAASEVYAPPQGSRLPVASMLVVTAIDLAAPRIAQSLAIVGTVDAIYASPTSLFVTSSRYPQVVASAAAMMPIAPSLYITDVHQIALGAQSMSVVASTSLEGFLDSEPEKASFRMSEYQGRLRIVTSSGTWWGGVVQNRLTILEPSTLTPGLLKTVSFLPNKQRPEPLGKPGELIYSTRFVDDRLYAVSFKKIDPLYIVDLSNVADPRITGALELPGFSQYLHPLPNGLLLGFGKEAIPANVPGDGQFAWYQGLQLTLFDVRDGSTLREMQRVVMGKRGSDSVLLRDHHAFSMFKQSDNVTALAMPVRIHDGTWSGDGASAWYSWRESGLARFELRGSTAADAQLVALPSMITLRAPEFAVDPATTNGRAVQFPNATLYVGDGKIWRLDKTGALTGPH